MFNFLYGTILNLFKSLKEYPKFQIVLGILKSWYVLIVGAGIMMVYYLYNALEKKGVISWITTTLKNTIGVALRIGKECFIEFDNLQVMWDCIQLASMT